MNDIVTIRGYVATDVRSTTTDTGLPVAGFRICTTERRFDRMLGSWRDGQTNWYSVNLFRQLAVNVGVSVQKGDKVVVTGRLRIRSWVREDGRTGTAVEIDADAVGHDLAWGTARYRRNPSERSSVESGPVGSGAESPMPAAGHGSVDAEGEEPDEQDHADEAASRAQPPLETEWNADTAAENDKAPF